MKIIVSHDVDHLYASDHYLKDLIIPKLWVKSFLHLCRGKISLRVFLYRLSIVFRNRMTRIPEIMKFDKAHNIPSIFFFGMDNLLGMSYRPKKAVPYIKLVLENGFDAGVHGCEYKNQSKIKTERELFLALSRMENFGVRNHYVRFDEQTFEKMAAAGYLFDSTYFNKTETELKAPYKVGGMWEFPLHIMDGYVCKPGGLEKGLEKTFAIVEEAEAMGMPYCTILFHDNQFDERYDPTLMDWYVKTIEWLEEKGYEFISYRDAIKELEAVDE